MDMEQEIQAAGANVAPRIIPDDIEANIASEHYFTAADGVDGADIEASRAKHPAEVVEIAPQVEDPDIRKTSVIGPLRLVTICVMILKNGHRIVGVNEGPVSVENFDADLGRKLAREKAIDQIWPLMGYELRSKLAFKPEVMPASYMLQASKRYTEADVAKQEYADFGNKFIATFRDGMQVIVDFARLRSPKQLSDDVLRKANAGEFCGGAS